MVTTVGEPDTSAAPARQSARSAARLAFRRLLVLCLGSLIATGVLAYRHWSYQQRITESSRTLLVSLTAKAAASIDDLARETTSAAQTIADDLTTGRLSKEGVIARIKATTERHAHFHGVCVSYAPYAFDPRRRLYSAYYTRLAGRLTFVQADAIYDSRVRLARQGRRDHDQRQGDARHRDDRLHARERRAAHRAARVHVLLTCPSE